MIDDDTRKDEEEIFIPMYELDICVRNGAGDPTGKRRRFKTHKPDTLAAWWYRNTLPPARRKRKHPNNKKKTLQRKKKANGPPVSKGT
jgi:hypothetical protein